MSLSTNTFPITIGKLIKLNNYIALSTPCLSYNMTFNNVKHDINSTSEPNPQQIGFFNPQPQLIIWFRRSTLNIVFSHNSVIPISNNIHRSSCNKKYIINSVKQHVSK